MIAHGSATYWRIWVVWQRKFSSLIYHWNQWLGSIAFILAVWGILAFFDVGGSFGLLIIGQDQGVVGVLCVLGFVILGVVLVAPRACFRLVANSVLWLGRQLRRQPVPKTAPTPPLTPTPLLEAPRPSKPEPWVTYSKTLRLRNYLRRFAMCTRGNHRCIPTLRSR